jgi:hypothetical protein
MKSVNDTVLLRTPICNVNINPSYSPFTTVKVNDNKIHKPNACSMHLFEYFLCSLPTVNVNVLNIFFNAYEMAKSYVLEIKLRDHDLIPFIKEIRSTMEIS